MIKFLHAYGAAILFTILGMVGLYFKVEYSGWVLFVGLVCALF